MGLGELLDGDTAEFLEGIARRQDYYTTRRYDQPEIIADYGSLVKCAGNYLTGEFGNPDIFASRILDGLSIAETQSMLFVLGTKGPVDGFSVLQRKEFLANVDSHVELSRARRQAINALSGAGLIEKSHYLRS